ncbi:MAG TPA: pilin [Actinospica sp.]|jgi:hypothetical protein|nr:pilin [Actinospica sp.]
MHGSNDAARPETGSARIARPPARLRRGRLRIAAIAAATAMLTMAASPALAASGPYLAADDIPTVIGNVTKWLIGILAVLATLMLTIGGVRYVLAAGDPAEVEKAKTCFKSAAMGYCLAVLAPVVVTVLKSLVGG